MAQPYVGEIRMFAGNFAPVGWAFCDGQLMPISENDALFSLIGTTYGGDGQQTFAMPNLQGRFPIHVGTNAGVSYQIGEAAGVEEVTLTTSQIPAHTHPLVASMNVAQDTSPSAKTVGQTGGGIMFYAQDQVDSALNAQAIAPAGGSQPHSNYQPYLCVNFIISLFGIFPSQT